MPNGHQAGHGVAGNSVLVAAAAHQSWPWRGCSGPHRRGNVFSGDSTDAALLRRMLSIPQRESTRHGLARKKGI
jgi:hypothetical protein